MIEYTNKERWIAGMEWNYLKPDCHLWVWTVLWVLGIFFVCLFCSLHNFHPLFLTHAVNTLKISDVKFVFLMYAFVFIILLKHHKQISIFYRSKNGGCFNRFKYTTQIMHNERLVGNHIVSTAKTRKLAFSPLIFH